MLIRYDDIIILTNGDALIIHTDAKRGRRDVYFLLQKKLWHEGKR